jgi:hypothetical protein
MNVPSIIQSSDGAEISPELEPLLLAIYNELAKRATDHRPLRIVLEDLLTFLSSKPGRTNANCSSADLFFCLGEGWGDVDWDHVPPVLGDIMADMGGALHDTIKDPSIAEAFGATPELLLTRLRAIDSSSGARSGL